MNIKRYQIRFRFVASTFLVLTLCFVFGGGVLAATNLVENGGAEAGDLSGWTVSSGTGYTWALNWNMPPHSGDYDFSSSYNWPNTMEQTIDLVAAGYTAGQLDASPDIDYSVWISQRFDHAGQYRLTFQLQDTDYGAVVTKYIDDDLGDDALNNPIALSANTAWHEKTHTFSGYSSGVRYAYIKIEADDGAANWGGNYGATFDDISISVADTTSPTVSNYFPVDGATAATTTANLVLTFDEAVDVESGNIIIYDSDDNIFEQIPITSNNITGSGTTEITVNATSTFTEQTSYYVQIDATAFDDTASNSYVGILDTTTWNFTTGDFTDPTIASTFPADGATVATTTANLVLTFDEAVDAESGNITIYDSEGTEIEVIDVTSGSVTGSGTTEININPSLDLSYETSYYVQIDATAFDDTASNSYAGILDTTTFNFTTEDTPTCPSVDNAATYNVYPDCSVATCNDGYNLSDGVCTAVGGGVPLPPPSVGLGLMEVTIGMGKLGNISLVDSQGVNVLMYIWSKAEFQAVLSNEKNRTNHSVYIEDLDLWNNKIKVLFQSESVELELSLYETKEVDLNNDGINDIEATFSDLIVNRIELTLIYLKEPTKTKIKKPVIEETKNTISVVTSPKADYDFTRDLYLGLIGDDVKELQRYLNNSGFVLAKDGFGALGNETTYFGILTQKALSSFQKANDIFPTAGYFGIITRGYIESQF